ncbi:MAG: hypothetical protein ACXVDT_15555 [Bacteroidia bacterium]
MKQLLYILLFISSTCFSQSKFTLIKNIDAESDYFTSDNQGNTYAVKGNELTKYDKTGKLLYKYSDKNFGNISFVDASNMLRILVFYKDFLQVVLLDNTLSITGDPINLETIGFQQTQLVSSSHNNGFWLYDQQNFELIRFDQNLTKTQQTGNLTAVLNIDLQPDFLLEYDNKVYLNNPSTGILIFDVYGTYYKTVPVKNAACIQPIGDWIYYMEKDKVKAYNIKTEEEKEFNMPATKFNNFRIELGILMLRTPASISLYTAE